MVVSVVGESLAELVGYPILSSLGILVLPILVPPSLVMVPLFPDIWYP